MPSFFARISARFPPRFSRAAHRRWLAALASTLIAALGIELFALHALDTTESRLIDVYLQRHAADMRPDPDIVIIDIDDASMAGMQEIAGLWAWPREIHADLLEALAEFKPRVVVFDVAFSEKDLKRPKSDARLSDVLAASPQVYLSAARLLPQLDSNGVLLTDAAAAFGVRRVVSNLANGLGSSRAALQLPLAVDPKAWRLGLTNSRVDADGILRRYPLRHEVHGWMLPSLPARVAEAVGVHLPDARDVLMRWPQTGHQRFSYVEVFRLLTEQRPGLGDAQLRTLDSLFRNKIVVIGASAAGSFDHHLTPLGAGYPGVDVLALAIDNLKNNHGIVALHTGWPFLMGAVLIIALAIAFGRRVNPLLTGMSLALVSLLSLIAADLALSGNLLLPVATPLLFAWTWFLWGAVAGYLRERKSREQAVSLFGRFLNPNVVRQIVDQGETVESLSGRTSEITVLFSDIRGFTTLSESRPPHEVVALLNRYFDKQVEVVFRHGGTLDKFIGDCIMAFWGAPVDEPAHARRAVAAAIEMQDTLIEFKKELAAGGSDVADFDVGIGVHTGAAVVGFIGAQRKLDYTAIGDTVNLASRVEGLTKGVARILVTRDTMQACEDAGAFQFKHRGSFAVKGRSAEVQLYEPTRSAS